MTRSARTRPLGPGRFPRLDGSTTLLLALVVLLPVLAVLQYRWLGQVSDAELERLRTGWNASAERLALDVDRELSRAFLLFQQQSHLPAGRGEADYATRLQDWDRVSPYPRLIARAFVVRATDAGGSIDVREVTREGTLTPVPWPEALTAWRARITAELIAAQPRAISFPTRLPLVFDDVPALLVSLNEVVMRDGELQPPHFVGFAVLQIDADYLRTDLLPRLVRRHFGEATKYAAAVLDRGAGRILYGTDPSLAVASFAHPDASAPILRVRFNEMGDLLHDPGSGVTKGARSFSLNVYRRETVTPQASTSAPAAKENRILIRSDGSAGAWQFVVKHAAGSLEAAVASGRRRNLVVSFGVLIVLAGAVTALAISTGRAQRLARQQLEFVAGVSHELRTPLAVIRSAGENLADGVIEDAVQVRRYGALVAGEGRRLTEMVEQVLEFAGNAGRRPLRLQRVDVADLVERTRRTWMPLAVADAFTLEVDVAPGLPEVLADPAALERAVGNLLSNAIKYSGDSRSISLSAGRDEATGHVVIAVADRGIGIPESERREVFEPFYRGRQAVDRQIHGNGLGLSLVRAVAEAHHGRVVLAGRPGGGTVASLELPVAPPSRSREPAGAVERPHPAG